MTATAEYFKAAKTEKLAETLAERGYHVARDHAVFDLVATKPGEKVGYEVLVPPVPPEVLAALRVEEDKCQGEGFTELRTVIATEPKRVRVEVDGLDSVLLRWLQDHVPPELETGPVPIIDSVEDVDIEELVASPSETEVAGSGTVSVDLEYAGGVERDGMTSSATFPFTFRLWLTPEWEIDEAREPELEVDTRDWREGGLRV